MASFAFGLQDIWNSDFRSRPTPAGESPHACACGDCDREVLRPRIRALPRNSGRAVDTVFCLFFVEVESEVLFPERPYIVLRIIFDDAAFSAGRAGHIESGLDIAERCRNPRVLRAQGLE